MKILCAINHDAWSILALHLLRPYWQAIDATVAVMMTSGIGRSAKPALPQLAAFEQQPKYLNRLADLQLPVTALTSVNTTQGHALIAQHDVVISLRFGSIFKAPAIALAKGGIFNLHSAILPHYRGVLGTFHALRCAQTQLGCTLHRISDNGIDTGDILAVAQFAANRDKSLAAHLLTLYQAGVPLVGQLLHNIATNQPLAPLAQDAAAGNYYTTPTDEQVADFLQQGWRIVDPHDSLDHAF